jgi:adenylate cyclase, class 2
MPNIELKAHYPKLPRAREIAIELNAEPLWKDEQIDTYFITRAGKLKLRESKLNGSELIPYVKVDKAGLMRSDYTRLPVANPELTKSLLNSLLGIKLSVKKQREVFLRGNIRIHLDEVENLGSFIEFEAVFEEDTPEVQSAERKKVYDLMKLFEISPGDVLDSSYPELLLKKKHEEQQSVRDQLSP